MKTYTLVTRLLDDGYNNQVVGIFTDEITARQKLIATGTVVNRTYETFNGRGFKPSEDPFYNYIFETVTVNEII